MFHIAEPDEIKAGKVTDVYFERTIQVLKAAGIQKFEVAMTVVPTVPA